MVGWCGYRPALVNMVEIFFFLLSQWLFAFCYVVSVMKFEVFWDVTPCQLVNS